MYKHACKTDLEGVVSKVRDSRYSSVAVAVGAQNAAAAEQFLDRIHVQP
jgi:hypothetical protein